VRPDRDTARSSDAGFVLIATLVTSIFFSPEKISEMERRCEGNACERRRIAL